MTAASATCRRTTPPATILRPAAELEAQLTKLCLSHRGRGAGEEVGPRLRLREGDDLSDVVLPGQHGGHPVEAEGDASMRGYPVPERLQQEAEPFPGLVLRVAQDPED